MDAAGTVLVNRFQQLKQKQEINSDVSIESNVGNILTSNSSIELPAEIKVLITGNEYWVNAKSNRYKKLIRDGHLDKLLKLAKMAHSKDNPAHWFATTCSKAAWERTLAYFAKLTEVVQKADQVARRIGTKVNKFIYKQIWKGVNVERWAIQAEEMRHDKPGQDKLKHFGWLCQNEKLVLAGGKV